MKKLFALPIVLCLLIASMSNVSFAQSSNTPPADDLTDATFCSTQSSVCGTAPEQFTQLMDFVREMSNAIRTIGTKGEYMGQYINPNRFKGDQFNPPQKTLLGRVARNISQKAQFSIASVAILSSPTNVAGLKDMIGGLTLLVKNRVFLRDASIVQKLESAVNDKKYELGLGGGRYASVNQENRAIMQGIIQKYIDKGILLPGSSLNDGVLYSNITSLLTQVLSSAKTFLYLGSTSQFDDISRGSSDQNIGIYFSSDAIQKMDRSYDCAKGPNYICSKQHTKIKQMLTVLGKSLTNNFSSSIKLFKDANKRMGQLFSPNTPNESFTQRENDLLRSMYGTKKISSGVFLDVNGLQQAGSDLKDVRKDTKNIGTAVGQFVSGTMIQPVSQLITYRSLPKNLKETVDMLPSKASLSADTLLTTDVTKSIDQYLVDVFSDAQADLDLVIMSEPIGVTQAFSVLGNQISVIENDIIGGKDMDDSLIKNLGVACELQCGGGGSCR